MLNYRELKPKSGKSKELVVLLHGYGSNKDDLIAIAPDMSDTLPDAHFISPDAPLAFEGGMFGARQWFSLLDRSEKSMLSGVRSTTTILEDFTKQIMEKFNIKHNRLAFIGFSQGAMVALHTGLRMKNSPKALLCYSGALIAPHLLQTEATSKPEIMLIHGREDQVVHSSCMGIAQNALKSNNIYSECVLRPKLAHGIDAEGIRIGREFLQKSFSKQKNNE